jgi:hypothetical protein
MVRMGTTPLDGTDISLHIQGVTIRSDNGRIAVSIKKYRLRSADRKASMSSAKLRLA